MTAEEIAHEVSNLDAVLLGVRVRVDDLLKKVPTCYKGRLNLLREGVEELRLEPINSILNTAYTAMGADTNA